ncbi:putative defect at low temperature protein 1 [[Candida] jaroonii]|uniref:Defect at low temperature protein 1 n=1 Tax=[Candida] jaroonii TaxID=467808 RepID=A0ACA9YDR7_9ASCO|nr:putative defect at low temperature protein 1 [[Candida] jaroonii]
MNIIPPIQPEYPPQRLRLVHPTSTRSNKLITNMLTNYQTRVNTVKTEIGPQLPSFNLPRRLFRWIYSVSLFILVSILMALIAVTPIDVIVQTASASFSGIKLFIVIVVCVLFLIISFTLYFSRIYQHRVAMNDIPNHSMYVPQEHDLPKRIYHHIDEKNQYCKEVQEMAGPLTNDITINYPGMQPPEYIQARNVGSGNLLPPSLHYDEVIRSFTDKFTILENFESSLKTPKHFTFREMVLSIAQDLRINRKAGAEELPNFSLFLSLYEKFKFSGKLIEENEMVDFMVECIKFTSCLVAYYGSVFAVRRKKYRDKQAWSTRSITRSDLQYPSYSPSLQNSAGHSFEDVPESYVGGDVYGPANEYQGHIYGSNNASYSQDFPHYDGLKVRRRNTESSQGSELKRYYTNGSQGSVVRQKLSISDQRKSSSVMFNLDNQDFKRTNTHTSFRPSPHDSVVGMSGYNSEVEEDDTSIYNFRPRSHSQVNTIPQDTLDIGDNDSLNSVKRLPSFYFQPSTPQPISPTRSQSPTKVLDLEIKRSKSPKKR